MKTLWIMSALALSLSAFGQTSTLGSGTSVPANVGTSNQAANPGAISTQPSLSSPSQTTTTTNTGRFSSPSDVQRMEDVGRVSTPSSNPYGGALGGSSTPNNSAIPSTTPTGSGSGIGTGTTGLGTGVGAPTSNAP